MAVRLLSEIRRDEEKRAGRARLTIFFGFAPGVGKTYAMLRAAQDLQRRGVDTVAGWIETHARPDTEALTEGLERVASRVVDDEGILTKELDVDAVIARKPHVVLVDELAHRNAPGMRRASRWQDVLDLLHAGIDVYTTLNVHHVESLRDVITQVTGVVVHETVPDAILDRADDIDLIDLPTDALLQRLHDGKILVNEQSQRAVAAFFRKGNLLALREMALRRAAERVDDQMRDFRARTGVAATWAVGERIAVCVGPSPASLGLVRATCRIAQGLDAPWYATYVETPAARKLATADRLRVGEHLALAERLGGAPVRLSGDRVATELLRFARQENITQIVVGKPTHARWLDFVQGSLLDDLLRDSGDIGIYAIRGDATHAVETPAAGDSTLFGSS